MGPHSSERRDVESCVPNGRKTQTVHDDISPQIPPPAIGLMLSVSPTNQLASNSLLWEENQSSAGRGGSSLLRDQDNYQEEAPSNTLPTRKSSLNPPRASRTACSMAPSCLIDEPSEHTALLKDADADTSQATFRKVSIAKDWDEIEGKSRTAWGAEFLVLSKYSLPLILTCVLQYSLTGASVIAVGHLGKTELAAVSLAIMTSNVTGYCAYAGLATSLDTLCAQAYGSGKPHLVGLQVQRMVYFLWLITLPVAAMWFSGTQILLWITPDRECAELAGLFLKVLILGAPGFATFEAGKRFVQAQGLFNANLYVLLICAPLNAFMNWLFVWVRTIGQSGWKVMLITMGTSVSTGVSLAHRSR